VGSQRRVKGTHSECNEPDLGVSTATHNDLNQLTGVSASAGPVKFAGRLTETGEVYVANSLATMGIQNTSFVAYATLSTGTSEVEIRATDYSTNSVTNIYDSTRRVRRFALPEHGRGGSERRRAGTSQYPLTGKSEQGGCSGRIPAWNSASTRDY
jgi:hypothetical protein